MGSLRLVKGILKRGEPVLIFPEGTRSRDGRLQDFKPGLALMAMEGKTPIVPTHISGAYELMPPGKSLPKPGRLTVTFGEPVHPESYDTEPGKDDLYRRIARDIQSRIIQMANGEPPGQAEEVQAADS